MYSEIPQWLPSRADISSVVVLERDDLYSATTEDIIEYAFCEDALFYEDGETFVWIRYSNATFTQSFSIKFLGEMIEGLRTFVENLEKLRSR